MAPAAAPVPASGIAPRSLAIYEAIGRRLAAAEPALDEELSLREGRRVKAALKLGRLLNIKTLAGYDFAFQPSLDRNLILTLAGLDFIDRHEVVHFLGQPRCGKTHLAIALAIEAVQAGRSVYFATLAEMIGSLAKAEREGTLRERIRFLCRPQLLVVDEIGYLPALAGSGSLFYQLVNARYERGAMILTSNRRFAEWGEVFGDTVVATALVDRLLHHAIVVRIEGASYRLRRHADPAARQPRVKAAAPGRHSATASRQAAKAANARTQRPGVATSRFGEFSAGASEETSLSIDSIRRPTYKVKNIHNFYPAPRNFVFEGISMGRARNFAEYVDKIRDAERILIAAGQNIEERVTTIRGLYYGTLWSLDFRVEASHVRNTGFFTYTSALPIDPRPLLSASQIRDLQDSQSMRDGPRSADVGHIIIGLETRFRLVRTFRFPRQGGTGLEITTWIGDLGGGAARLALHRVRRPTFSVRNIFHNRSSDFGVTDNLEGDIGAYLVASGGTAGGRATFAAGGTLADALQDYFSTTGTLWPARAAGFATALGATISGTTITNATTMTSNLADKLEEFACWYAATRYLPNGQITAANANGACSHLRGASEEVASVLVSILSHAIANPADRIQARPPYPAPTPAGASCSCSLLAAVRPATGVTEEIERQIWRARDLFNRVF